MNISETLYKQRRDQIPERLWAISLDDFMVKSHCDAYIAGIWTMEEMLMELVFALANDKKIYLKAALQNLSSQPPKAFIVGASAPVAIAK